MGLGSCRTIALDGVIAREVTIEANVGPGLPGIHVVGLADTAITESRARIRTAVNNTRLPWPRTKVVVSLTPASMPKSGAHFDLPMALAILTANMAGWQGDVAAQGWPADPDSEPQPDLADSAAPRERLDTALVLGELGLDGSVRPVSGIVPAMLAAKEKGYDTLVIPPANAAEALLVPGLDVLVAATLVDAFAWVTGYRRLPTAAEAARYTPATAERGSQSTGMQEDVDFADIAGQREAKTAAEVAAAGGHHLFLTGPPGSGKSMIAARMPGILPPLTAKETMEATAIHSIVGAPGHVVDAPPFIAPHASLTRAALLGGGPGIPRPGAVSLAHTGVLFLDEVSEIPAAVLDGLRTPLEEGRVRIVRARREVEFPARFQLVLAANPCRCAAEDPTKCTCTAHHRREYLRNLSGPLRDRLDMVVRLSQQSAVISADGEESTADIRQRVCAARERAAHRWQADGLAARHNAAVSSSYLRRHRPADDAAMAMLSAYLAAGDMSQRGIDRCLKLAWTLYDLDGEAVASTPGASAPRPNIDHVARAMHLRGDQVMAGE